jgi:hypothetical protein
MMRKENGNISRLEDERIFPCTKTTEVERDTVAEIIGHLHDITLCIVIAQLITGFSEILKNGREGGAYVPRHPARDLQLVQASKVRNGESRGGNYY